ncbi:hypothetical protein [Mycobacterium kiyosense]|nr:hypothetical protein IWGMT90018_51970 [Mycobacterium kiyosense]
MYDPHAALEAIDSHTLSILLFYAVAVLAGFVYFIEAIRLTISQKVYAVPLATAIFIFAHDLSFLVYYDKWFNQYGHWWCKAWWFVLLITVPLEMLLIYFVARYGRAETFPLPETEGFYRSGDTGHGRFVRFLASRKGCDKRRTLFRQLCRDGLFATSIQYSSNDSQAISSGAVRPYATDANPPSPSATGRLQLYRFLFLFTDLYQFYPRYCYVGVREYLAAAKASRKLPPARVTWRVMGLTVRPAEELARVGCAMATLTDLALPVAPDDRVVDDSLKLPWSSADDNDDARLPAGSTSATPSAVAFDPPERRLHDTVDGGRSVAEACARW